VAVSYSHKMFMKSIHNADVIKYFTHVNYGLSIISCTDIHCIHACTHAVYSNCASLYAVAVSYPPKMFMKLIPGADVIKHFMHVTRGINAISCTAIHCTHAPMQCKQNALAYFAVLVGYIKCLLN
jgi:hypothetical protein